MTIELSDIDFETPAFVVHHYFVAGSVDVVSNSFIIYLMLFQNKNMDVFRYYILSFQLSCFFCDIHLSFLMQPIPLFPLRAGYAAGLLSNYLSTHILMSGMCFFLSLQLNSLTVCFIRKHDSIAKINSKRLSRTMYYGLCLPFVLYPIYFTTSFYCTEISKDVKFRILTSEYSIFRPQFDKLPEYGLYEMNGALITFLLLTIAGCLASTVTISLLVFLMYKTLLECRNNLSQATMSKHRNALRSLIAQCLTAPIATLPAMLAVSTIFIPFEGAQLFTWYNMMALTTHSTINCFVVIFTYPEFRAFVIFWSKEGKQRRATQKISTVVSNSSNVRTI